MRLIEGSQGWSQNPRPYYAQPMDWPVGHPRQAMGWRADLACNGIEAIERIERQTHYVVSSEE